MKLRNINKKVKENKFALTVIGTFLVLTLIVSFISISQMKQVSAAFCIDDNDCIQECISTCTWRTGICDTVNNVCETRNCDEGYSCQVDSTGCDSGTPECSGVNNCDNEKYYDDKTCDGSGNCNVGYDQLSPSQSESSCDCYSGGGIYGWDTSYRNTEDITEKYCCLGQPASGWSPDFQDWADYDTVTRAVCEDGVFYECIQSEIGNGEGFEVENSSGNVLFRIDGDDGDAWTRKNYRIDASSINKPSTGFIVNDSSTGNIVFKVDNDELAINQWIRTLTIPSATDDGLKIENSTGDIVAFFDTDDLSGDYGHFNIVGDYGGGCGDWLD